MGEVEGYPHWDGELSKERTYPRIILQELKRTWQDPWGLIAIVLVASFALFYVASLQTSGITAHTQDNAMRFLNLLRWGSLGLAAVMAGPAFLEDRVHGALQLYLSRAVTRLDYLAGKIGATYGLATLAMLGPGLIYWIVTFLLFQEHPTAWMRFPLGVIVYSLLWGAVVTGLGLGLSSVSRSSRATALILFGSFAVADVFISDILQGITKSESLQILSPFSAHAQQIGWLFKFKLPFDFPYWWGLIHIALLIGVGWFLVYWKHPRLEGVES